MTNAIISLALTFAIAATLGSQIATTAYRQTAVRATLAGNAPHIAHHDVTHGNNDSAS